jgi:hypothetical protein
MAKGRPDRTLLASAVTPEVLHALNVASAALTRAGVRHLVVGGLAVAAHGYARSTKDVDFLVGDEAFERHEGGIVTMRPGVPIQVAGVVVDFLSIDRSEPYLESALGASGDIAPAEVLVYLKLKSPRVKDRADLVELVKAGLDVDAVRGYLVANAPDMVAKFDSVVDAAHAEE